MLNLQFVLALELIEGQEWLWNPENIKEANKDAKTYVGKSAIEHHLLFCALTLCMSYVTSTFLLVSSSVRSKQLLCFVHGQSQKSEQNPATKNLFGFNNRSSVLLCSHKVNLIAPLPHGQNCPRKFTMTMTKV